MGERQPGVMTMATLKVFSSSQEMAEAAAALFAARSALAVSAQGRFTAALSGGKTPPALYTLLAGEPYLAQIPWPSVHLFWGDERCVPPDHADSNYRLARDLFIDRVPIPPANVHRMQGEMDPVEAAALYEEQLRTFFKPPGIEPPALDFILLGLGEDGHTASLFPGTAPIREKARWVEGHYVDEEKGWRITLTPPVINAARTVVFLVAGFKKAAVLRDVLDGPFRPDILPAQIVHPDKGELLWMLDRDASALLSRKG